RFDLRYGAGSLPLESPERKTLDVLVPVIIDDTNDIERTFVNAIEKPIDSESLSQIVSHANSVAVVVNGDSDIESIPILLNTLLENLQTSLSGPTELLVIYPTDSQKVESLTDVSKQLGIHEKDGYQLVLQDAKSNECLSFIGETPTYCTPVHVNKAFLDAEVKIGIGTIRSNIFTGATGGRMSVLPHCCGIKSILRNTKLQATQLVGPFVTDSAVCVDLEGASRLACLDFIVNTIPDWKNNLNEIVAGNPYTAWKRGVTLAQNMTETFYKHKADIAIVSAGGSSNDHTLFNAVDALYAGKEATEYGGVIVLVAECANGIGSDGFLRGVSESGSSKEVALLAETGFEMGMEKSRFFWDILNSRKVIICSRLRESMIEERFHCSAVRNPQEGYELARSFIVSSPSIAVIPHGIRTLPVMRNG
ncbi:MAG: lactate racemase domain-containing protein, partial [Candidatus Thorarchaeota archaeon]|nr:lactate racemase domain-containing protein [Candidatus Thorarchaeota archaeon]